MAERELYNSNDQISFPFIHGDPLGLLPPATLPRQGIVDAGFVMGIDSEFDIETDSVYLHSFYVNLGSVFFDFRSNATGFSSHRFLFDFPAGSTAFGTTCYADATLITGGPEEPNLGRAFLTVGDLTDILSLGDTLWTLTGLLRIEPGLIQTEVGSFISSVAVGNKARCCPEACGVPSSSSSSEAACDPDRIFLQAQGLMGDILFREGNNIGIQLDEANNAILFDALLGLGEGETCEDVIIDGDGDGGFHRGESCLTCGEVIRSVNGRVIPGGKLVLSGWPGVQITPDSDNHLIYITLNPEKFCEGTE